MPVRPTDISWTTLKEYVQTKPDKEYKYISPSSLGGCMRAHYWKIKGVKATTPPNPGALVNFEVGRHWEAVLAEAYKSKGMLLKWWQDGVDEPFIDPETGLGGTPDILINLNSEKVIVDSKTVNSLWFKYAKSKQFSQWVKENDHYITQQIAYIILARASGLNVKKAILSFASKDDGYIGLEIEITPTDEDITKVKERAKRLKGYVERDELPPCECEGWKVGFCQFGQLSTRKPNTKKKLINTICCPDSLDILESWRQVG